ncbi:MAG: Re/Si-specific NAD(P)(+) transhydrogenase subunit alpha [Gammaproteobacteria bacterium]|nr:Re/Si-specific NAD(P)(+) transhydrogenase subunit alpha [Gammaproteobacteria bacterium]
MSTQLVILRETEDGEHRVALAPAVVKKLTDLGFDIHLEAGAGEAAGIPDEAFDVSTSADRSALLGKANVVFAVQPPSPETVKAMQKGAVLVSFMHPHKHPELVSAMKDGGITGLALERVPRISRAQSMDALSSQAACAGYRAALIAATSLHRFLPMLTTAAGTIRPAKVLVIGAGVAGLQAIATARRLGAMVEGFDVRSATREQVESLGAKFVDTGIKAEGEGGYARELTDEEKEQQNEVLADHIAAADAVITTAAIPGKPAPKIISAAMVERMKPGAVIIDMAAETGGNCEVTKAGEEVAHGDARVIGPVNLPSDLAEHASEMYARNLLNFVMPWFGEDGMSIDWDDEVYAKSVLTRDGEIVAEDLK